MRRPFMWSALMVSASLCLAAAPERKPAAIADLIQQLSSLDSSVRQQAAQQLGNLGAAGRPAVAALVQVLTKNKEPMTRQRAASALAQIGSAAVTPLAELLKHEDEFVRRQAVSALARIGPDARAAQPALVAALKDSSLLVRGLAADALGEIDADVPATARALVAILAENGPTRRHARAALVRLGRPAVPVLADALKQNDAGLRYHSIRVLGLLGSEAGSAVPQLIDALADREPRVRRGIGSNRAALAVVQLRRDDPRALERLKKELERFAPKRVSPALLAALDPARQQQNEQFLHNFVLAASPDFGIGISEEANNTVAQLGTDAIPALVRILNQLAANPGKNIVIPIAKLTPSGPRKVGSRTFWFV